MSQQLKLPITHAEDEGRNPLLLRKQLLKWVGNKQRFAYAIISTFPVEFGTYLEPFLGAGAVLGTLAPKRAVGSDICEPLLEIWKLVHDHPECLAKSYSKRWEQFKRDRRGTYDTVKAHFNRWRSPEDLFFLSRTCYARHHQIQKRRIYEYTDRAARTS